MADHTDQADKPDGVHDWTPHHMRADTPAQRAANKASAKTAAAKEAPAALDEAVKAGKRESAPPSAAKKRAKK